MGESLQRCRVAWRQPQCDMRRCDYEAKGRRLGEKKGAFSEMRGAWWEKGHEGLKGPEGTSHKHYRSDCPVKTMLSAERLLGTKRLPIAEKAQNDEPTNIERYLWLLASVDIHSPSLPSLRVKSNADGRTVCAVDSESPVLSCCPTVPLFQGWDTCNTCNTWDRCNEWDRCNGCNRWDKVDGVVCCGRVPMSVVVSRWKYLQRYNKVLKYTRVWV